MEESLSRSMVEVALPGEDDGREIETRVGRSLAGVDGGSPRSYARRSDVFLKKSRLVWRTKSEAGRMGCG